MRVRVPVERGRLFADDPTGSRWWYWVAAVPVGLAFWLLGVGWVALAVSMVPAVAGGALGFAAAAGLVVLGVPLAVVLLAFPFAVLRDADRVAGADVGWRPARTAYAAAAAVGPAVGAAALAVGLAGVLGPTTPVVAAGLTGAYLLATPVALRYLSARRRRVGVP